MTRDEMVVAALNDHPEGAAPVTPHKPVITFLKDRSKTVDLQFPVEVDGALLDKVTVSRLTGQQLADMEGSTDPQLIYSLMCGLPVEVLFGLDSVDTTAILEVATDFLPQKPPTGSAPTGDAGTTTLPSSPAS